VLRSGRSDTHERQPPPEPGDSGRFSPQIVASLLL
jgi:hypothetical protein